MTVALTFFYRFPTTESCLVSGFRVQTVATLNVTGVLGRAHTHTHISLIRTSMFFRVKRVRVFILCSLPCRSLTSLLNIPHFSFQKSYPHQPARDPDLQCPPHPWNNFFTKPLLCDLTRKSGISGRNSNPARNTIGRRELLRTFTHLESAWTLTCSWKN